ncbi:MAG TPA: type II secretion system protein GspG [Verrucomicrobiae bacterium]|nr:type II secretion system protein GspG [Verrucomicrobiae bacterium]
MPDSALPPVPPPAPLPQTPPPVDALVLPDEPDASEALSPFKVLGKSGGASVVPPVSPAAEQVVPLPPVAPTPPIPTPPAPAAPVPSPVPIPAPLPVARPAVSAVPPVSSGSPMDEDIPDTEELIKQAAAAPSQPLILPSRGAGSSAPVAPPPSKPREEFVAADPVAIQESLKKIEVKSREGNPLPPPVIDESGLAGSSELLAPPPPPVAPLPMDERPVPVPLAPSAPKAEFHAPVAPPPRPPLAPKAPAPAGMLPRPVIPAAPPAPPHEPLPAAAPHRRSGILFAILGIVVVLALLGGGLYVLALSGARVPVLAQFISGLEGDSSRAINRAEAFVATHVPYRLTGALEVELSGGKESSSLGDSAGIFKVRSDLSGGLITDKGERFIAAYSITANDGTAVPVNARYTGSEFLVDFPANQDKSAASLSATSLRDTLLAPALQPVPLEVILKNAQAEQSYKKVSINQKPAASYVVGMPKEAMAPYFPLGAELEASVAEVALAWKDTDRTAGEPLDVQLQTTFSYQGHKYTYAAHWQYTGWQQQSPEPATLSKLFSTDPGNVATELTTESFVSRLGLSFAEVPHGGEATSGNPVDETTRFTPVIPSGDVITVVQAPRPEMQPVPTQPASELAKQRDAQRKQDLLDIQKALKQYKLEKGTYPVVSKEVQIGSDTTVFKELVPKYLTKMPVDPLNSTYYYAYNVNTDSEGKATEYHLRAVLEDHDDASALVGQVYHYYQLTNK